MRTEAPFVISSDDSEGEDVEPQPDNSPVVDMSDNMSVVGRMGDLAVKEELASEVEGDEGNSDTSTFGDFEATANPAAAEEDALLAEGSDQATVMDAAEEQVVLTPAQLKAANPEGGQQTWGDRLFPYDKRDPEQTITVVQAWMDGL
jgi:hypothetical protein